MGPETSLALHLRRLAREAEAAAEALEAGLESYAHRVLRTLEGGGRLLWGGNGGSAATAEHVAAEYAVRFRRDRKALPALCLASGIPALTAAANDLGYERVFARGVEAHARPGDLLILHSTSGRSPNLLAAAEAAAAVPVGTVALLGRDGGPLAARVDLALRVPAEDPAHVQELHLAIEHAVVRRVEDRFSAGESA